MAASRTYSDAAVPTAAWATRGDRRGTAPSNLRAAFVTGAGLVLGTASALLTERSPVVAAPEATAVVRGLVPFLYCAVGAALWVRRPASRSGLVLAGVGVGYALTTSAVSADPVWYSLGRLANGAWIGLFAYAFLAYPSGRLAGRADRLLVDGYFLVGGALWLWIALASPTIPSGGPLLACRGTCPRNGLQVAADPLELSRVAEPALQAVTYALLGGLLVLLAHRALSPIVVVRLTIVPPLLAASLLVAGYVAYSARPEGHDWWAVWAAVTVAGAIACPLGFGVGPIVSELFVSRSFARGVAVLAPDTMTSADIDRVCQTALGDHSARVEAVALHAGASARILVVDRVLVRGYERVLDMVERLAVTLDECADLLVGVRSSRRRLAAHESSERARLERDLHDGAQQRLLALQLQLAQLAERVRGSALEPQVETIAREAAAAGSDVRTISHGIYPSLLVERGLADAVRALPASPAIPIEVHAGELPRLDAAAERAVYYAVAEAVQNATKHSKGTAIVVTLVRSDGGIVATVADDGGGFDPEEVEGSPGLVGLRDRIESAGGTVEVESTVGEGTVVTLRVPLG